MASRSTPSNAVLTFTTTGQIPNISGGQTVGTVGQYQIWSDRAVWDTTNNKYLYPGSDFNPYALFVD